MRKIITIISFVLIICTLFASCAETDSLPSRTENFDDEFCESFFEDYYLADAGLAYYKASFEIKIPYEGRSNRYIMLGNINNTSQSQFVSAVYDVRNNFPMMGAEERGHIYVYQHKNSPHPMKDWNIESVSLIAGGYSHQSMNLVATGVSKESGFIDSSENYMNDRLASNSEIKIFKSDNETDIDFIEGIKNAYSNVKRDRQQTTVRYYGSGEPSKYYYLLVKFKESSDIIWYTPLIISYDGFRICHTFEYYEAFEYYSSNNKYANDTATFSSYHNGLETRYGTLSEEITNELYEILIADGWNPETNKPASSIITTDPHSENSGSTNVPIEDAVPQTD